jgi:hypothetical protein
MLLLDNADVKVVASSNEFDDVRSKWNVVISTRFNELLADRHFVYIEYYKKNNVIALCDFYNRALHQVVYCFIV